MTNKELIDYCNANWNEVHRCEQCPYNRTYCDVFVKSHHRETPYMMDTLLDGRYYTDEEIKL